MQEKEQSVKEKASIVLEKVSMLIDSNDLLFSKMSGCGPQKKPPQPSMRRHLTATCRVHQQHLLGTKRYASLSFFLRKMSALIK